MTGSTHVYWDGLGWNHGIDMFVFILLFCLIWNWLESLVYQTLFEIRRLCRGCRPSMASAAMEGEAPVDQTQQSGTLDVDVEENALSNNDILDGQPVPWQSSGPTRQAKSFMWPLEYIRRMFDNPWRDFRSQLLAKLQRGVRGVTDYSGEGKPESVSGWISQAGKL